MADLSNTDLITDPSKINRPATSRRRGASRPAGPPNISEGPATASPDATPTAGPDATPTASKPVRQPKAVKAVKTAPEASALVADVPVKTPKKAAVKKASVKQAAASLSAAPVPTQVKVPPVAAFAPIFQAPIAAPKTEVQRPSVQKETPKRAPKRSTPKSEDASTTEDLTNQDSSQGEELSEEEAKHRRRRRRGGRGRRRTGREVNDENEIDDEHDEQSEDSADSDDDSDDESAEDSTTAHRRRRRRRSNGDDIEGEIIDPDGVKTVVKVRDARTPAHPRRDADEAQISGSTRLEAKKQRRRDTRDTVRRRAPIITEAQFLARRESVDRQMLVRQNGDRTQIAVIEDKILVEHYVNRASNTSYVGNVYLGKVQNVLPSMEAAFVDIGKGRNAVLYAGEVNWDAAGLADGTPKRIETALKTGQNVVVQVTKDPIGQKGARLTSQISLPGRYLVYVPGGGMSGISRKLPDNERTRLKQILKQLIPEDAGVIVRTAAEGVSEEELTRDVNRLRAQWEDIEQKTTAAMTANSSAPALLYGEPDLTVRVIRDIFNEDFRQLTVQGDEAWDEVNAYLGHIAADLVTKLSHWTSEKDLFVEYRVEEQLAKALDRKVWLPSGGSLVIDRTEAMVVVDVNTGKFTGKGGNLEETVTKNNLEAAEEIARQLRLRDLGGIIVIDFIDMVLESNRDQVLRRLTECLGRDRTKHQVAEVTSLGLVQMTRKRIGQGLLEAFSTPCEQCHGRGVIIQLAPVDQNLGQRRHRHFEHRADSQEPEVGGELEALSVISSSAADTGADSEADMGQEFDALPPVALKGRRRPAKKATSAKRAKVAKKG